MAKILMEVCCGSYEDAVVAFENGADRIELNSSLFLGGITPSLGSFLAAKEKLSIPIMVMIRPREAGFCYSTYELEVMHKDAEIFLQNGADGLVFGFLNADGTLYVERMREFTALCKAYGKTAVCHRAFDVTPDPLAALEQLISIKVDRVLTSGQAPTAPDGAELIKALIKKADGRIEILPGAGLNAKNIQRFIEYTSITEVHFAAEKSVTESSTQCNRSIYFGGALYPREDVVSVADGDAISAIGAMLK